MNLFSKSHPGNFDDCEGDLTSSIISYPSTSELIQDNSVDPNFQNSTLNNGLNTGSHPWHELYLHDVQNVMQSGLAAFPNIKVLFNNGNIFLCL